MSNSASDALARVYLKTGAPLRVVGAMFGRDAAALSKIINGMEPSRPFATQLRNLVGVQWDQMAGTATITVRVPSVRQTDAQRQASLRQVGAKVRRKAAGKGTKKG